MVSLEFSRRDAYIITITAVAGGSAQWLVVSDQ